MIHQIAMTGIQNLPSAAYSSTLKTNYLDDKFNDKIRCETLVGNIITVEIPRAELRI